MTDTPVRQEIPTINDNTRKHLEMLQAIISRLSQNSFAYKGWCVTVTSGALALAVKDTAPQLLLIPLLPVLLFWGLDAFYLRQERLFRKLFNAVRIQDERVIPYGPFSMSTEPVRNEVASWLKTCFTSPTIWLYLPLLLMVVTVVLLITFKQPHP